MPIAPRKMSAIETVRVPCSMPPCCATWNMVEISNDPVARYSRMIPMSSPTSPMRVVMNAFFAASAAERRSYQKPISRNEPSPTSSQAT